MVRLAPPLATLLATCSAVIGAPSRRRSPVCTEIRQRVPWYVVILMDDKDINIESLTYHRTQLTQNEKLSYVEADLCLMAAPSKSGVPGAVTRWDDLQWPHVVQTTTVHNVGAFLPFHRYYIKVHERMIRDECNYTGRMP